MGNIQSRPSDARTKKSKSKSAKIRDMRATIAKRVDEANENSSDKFESHPAMTDADVDAMLDAMPFQDLDSLRRRVVKAQNSKNPLFCLPAELRNEIWRLACEADIEKQIEDTQQRPGLWSASNGCIICNARPQTALHPPHFLNACRQIKDEATVFSTIRS